ncbi:MAG TPA: CBS domain-containing protein [Thermoflexia bacterium]|nr:CBS domain-containing protein [Thermoflexia bacterium]
MSSPQSIRNVQEKEVTKLQELAYELKIAQAMTTDVITVSPETTMAEFREILRANRISGTPVVEGGKMIGIISIEDLIKALASGELEAKVGEKMTPNPETLYADEPLIHAVSKFERLGYGRFPVIDRDGNLVGIIVQGDIVRALLRQLEIEYHEEEIHRYRASHIFEDILADQVTLMFRYYIEGGNFTKAGDASSQLKRTLTRLGIDPRIVRRVAIASYEAEMNIVIYAEEGEITAEVRPEQIRIVAADKGPGIPDIEKAMEPGFSTAPEWVRELGFGAGMGLPNIQNCADEMKLESTVGVGTRLEILIYSQPANP